MFLIYHKLHQHIFNMHDLYEPHLERRVTHGRGQRWRGGFICVYVQILASFNNLVEFRERPCSWFYLTKKTKHAELD